MWIGFGPINDMTQYKFKKTKNPRPHNSPWNDDMERELIDLLDADWKPKKIAKKFGISVQSVKAKMVKLESSYVPIQRPTKKELAIDAILKKRGIK